MLLNADGTENPESGTGISTTISFSGKAKHVVISAPRRHAITGKIRMIPGPRRGAHAADQQGTAKKPSAPRARHRVGAMEVEHSREWPAKSRYVVSTHINDSTGLVTLSCLLDQGVGKCLPVPKR